MRWQIMRPVDGKKELHNLAYMDVCEVNSMKGMINGNKQYN